ncbi:hypothetical protein IKN40_01095 [bacterium]|nr:hypothetical protein [bacterium]
MYTGYSNGIGKNQMITSPTIAMTQAIVDNAINNLDLTATELFKYDEEHNAVETVDGMPLEASLFKITGTDEDIDADATNAVNKRYLQGKVAELDLKFETIADHDADMATVYTKTESDERFINVDEPVELLKRTEEIPITATIPTSSKTCNNSDFSNNYFITMNGGYGIKSSGPKHLVSSVSVSVSSGNISDLNLQMYFTDSSVAYNYTNNGDNTFTINEVVSNLTSTNSSSIRIRYKKNSGASTVTFSITAISISYDYSTTIDNYYDKTTVDDKLSTKLGVNDNAVSATKAGQIEYTYNNTTYALKPNGANIGFYNGNTEKIRFFAANGIIGCYDVRPNNIVFGTTSFGQDTKWSGTIVGVANDNYDSTTYSAVNTDTIVPSLKYLNNLHYTKTDADARFINVDEPVELLKRTEVIPITATIPTSNLTCSDTSFSSSYQTINSSYAIKRSGTSHLVSSVSVSVSSGNISDLKLQLYFAASGNSYAYTNNGNGTFSIDGDKYLYKTNGEVRLRYAKASSSAADVSFSITAVSISYDYSTTISEYYDKAETDALISNITIETPTLYNIIGTNASIISSDIVRDSYVVTAGKHYLISFTMTLTDLKDANNKALTYMPISAPYIVICKASNLTTLGTIYGYLNPLSSGWCINCIGILHPDTTSETKFLLYLQNVHATYNTLTNPSILKIITLD